MSDERFPTDPLRRVLTEMRADLDGRIGQEISRLLGSGAEAMASGPGVAVARAKDRPAAMTEFYSPPSHHLGIVGRGDDSGSRLDALARRLEGRLKRPRGRAGEPAAATSAGMSSGDRVVPSSEEA